MTDEELLPSDVLGKAIRSGREYAWRKDDFESVVIAARNCGLATIGGQPQFIFPDGTYELYWIEFDSKAPKQGDPWDVYVERSANEVIQAFRQKCAATDFRQEAAEFDFIKKKIEQSKIDPIDYLWFVGYFDARKNERPGT